MSLEPTEEQLRKIESVLEYHVTEGSDSEGRYYESFSASSAAEHVFDVVRDMVLEEAAKALEADWDRLVASGHHADANQRSYDADVIRAMKGKQP